MRAATRYSWQVALYTTPTAWCSSWPSKQCLSVLTCGGEWPARLAALQSGRMIGRLLQLSLLVKVLQVVQVRAEDARLET